ncbi:MAG: tRNA threonylcarbamoyladenosine dehydratase [Ruminococcaceae bacterium]|nr:tRNA threonylcarbamoyladenosine dehydratase [Oscillospiraceae bacterium]
MDIFTRTKALLGERNVKRLNNAHVLVFGLGGVGGHAVETLCRGGIGTLSLVDSECFEISNCNRQIFATKDTLGIRKTDAAKERLLNINSECRIKTYSFFYGKDQTPVDLFDGVDYILDAIDTVSSKMMLIEEAKKRNIPIISCMGTGNKLDPTQFRVTDIKKTKVCPLARVIRAECKKRNIKSLKVVYSEEEPISAIVSSNGGRHVPGSVSFVPGVAGMIMAGEIIKDIIK